MKKQRYLILTIIWMLFIFIMSQTPGDQSSSQSSFFVKLIQQWIPILKSFDLSLVVRKGAHMSEYAILMFLLYKTLSLYSYPHYFMIAYCLTVLYACSDEFHQLFIVGRAGLLQDVLIDSLGALIMVIVIIISKKTLVA